MLHRAIVGSLERFIGILIEQHAGALPAWLAPVQVVVASITDARPNTPRAWRKSLQKQGVRASLDLRNEKINYKIREHSMQKVPYILVVGDKEKANGAVAVRARGNQDLGVMPLADFQRSSPETSPQGLRWSRGAGAFVVFRGPVCLGVTQELEPSLPSWTAACPTRSASTGSTARSWRPGALNGVENEPLGIVSTWKRLRMAGEMDVDLVEIAATADPRSAG
jgi:hypothetical protein